VRLRGDGLPAGREGRLLGRLGLLNPGLAYALSLMGLTSITASLSVLLWAFEPIVILGLAAAILRERIGPGLIVASLVAVGGITLVLFDPSATGSFVGVSLTIAGVAACAIYTVATRRWLLGSDSTFGIVLAQQLHALALAVAMVVVLAILGGAFAPASLSPMGAVSAVVSGLLYYAFAYSLYISALHKVRASVAAASFYLIPVFGVSVAATFGERLQPIQWLGALLVIGAVGVIAIRAARPGDMAGTEASVRRPIDSPA
jgi:probable blue pigment (indigoidine) exporter